MREESQPLPPAPQGWWFREVPLLPTPVSEQKAGAHDPDLPLPHFFPTNPTTSKRLYGFMGSAFYRT